MMNTDFSSAVFLGLLFFALMWLIVACFERWPGWTLLVVLVMSVAGTSGYYEWSYPG